MSKSFFAKCLIFPKPNALNLPACFSIASKVIVMQASRRRGQKKSSDVCVKSIAAK